MKNTYKIQSLLARFVSVECIKNDEIINIKISKVLQVLSCWPPFEKTGIVSWGVKHSFFTKRILLFINNLQIFGKTGIFVPVFASQKANRN